MQRLEVSGAVRPIYGSLGAKGLSYLILFFWLDSPPPPHWVRAAPFTMFLDHTQRRNTDGRTPLDE
jgi:hypothetical protein